MTTSSLTNLLSNNIAGCVMANSVALSNMTMTTLAQAGTSLPQIVSNVNTSALNGMTSAGVSDASLFAPVTAMQTYAASQDPNNSGAYAAAAQTAMQQGTNSAAAALPGYTNSLVATQNAGTNAIATSVNSFGNQIQTINPGLALSALNVGNSGLANSNNLIGQGCATAFNNSSSTLTSTISNINTTTANIATADATASATAAANSSIIPLPTESDGTQAGTANYTALPTTSAGIDEGAPPKAGTNTTDQIYQEVKLYVEGVQIPYTAISVNQGIGVLPSASFQVPPQAGLMDIARYYQPKVHIFYTDNNLGGDRLLFWGHIVAVNYSRDKTQGSSGISFECVHKNALMEQITFEWSGGGLSTISSGGSTTDSTTTSSAQLAALNSNYTLMLALQGITGMQTNPQDLIAPKSKNPDVINADPTKLATRFQPFQYRMIGMPAAIMNVWNQTKSCVYSNPYQNVIFGSMFIPLAEDGIRFFDRMSGHYYLENQIQTQKVDSCNCAGRPEMTKYQTMLPPAYRLDIQSAVHTTLALGALKSSLNFSGENISFYGVFNQFYSSVEYEILTLSSPSEVPADPTVFVDPDDLTSWNAATKSAVETIVKPQIPFYYSPICNVLLPNMIVSISVNQAEAELPTRFTGMDTSLGTLIDSSFIDQSGGTPTVNFRAPHSIRQAVAEGKSLISGIQSNPYDLRDTLGPSFNMPGKYELGRGIKHKKIGLPHWLSNLNSDSNGYTNSQDQVYPAQGTIDYQNLLNLHFAWVAKYGYNTAIDSDGTVVYKRNPNLDTLDQYSQLSNIQAYERLLFSAADYEFTKAVAGSRSGTVQILFNPYIIPGYPMDIIESTPNYPSFHGMCAGVSHSITPRSIGTTVNFLAATSYTELSNYYMQPVHPWLRNALRMVNVQRGTTLDPNGVTASLIKEVQTAPATDTVTAAAQPSAPAIPSLSATYNLPADPDYDSNTGDIISIAETLINNPRAKAVADIFYKSVLGVGAADPGLIYDFGTDTTPGQGTVKPVKRYYGTWIEGPSTSSANVLSFQTNDNLTGVGSLRLVSRPIEGKQSIQNKFGIKFIDISPKNYNKDSMVYKPASTSYTSTVFPPTEPLLEPGASLFLDYPDVIDALGITLPVRSSLAALPGN